MKFGKRQLILASLVVALGAAVYLNWALQKPAVETGGQTSSEREYGQTQLVGASGISDTDLSSAEEIVKEIVIPASMTEAKLARQQARDSAVELLEKTIASLTEESDAKKAAAEKLSEISENILLENNIESLIKAKGYAECVAYLQNGECTVTVVIKIAQPNDAVVIKDIVNSQTGISSEKIKIVEVKP